MPDAPVAVRPSWQKFDVDVKPSAIDGQGAFAAEPIPARRKIGEIRGEAVSAQEARARAKGVSRVMIEAHSWSEVIAGLAAGSMVSVSTLWMARSRHARVPLWMPLGIAAWLAITPVHAPASTTHDMVTRLALKLSGRAMPHTREELHRMPARSPGAAAPW